MPRPPFYGASKKEEKKWKAEYKKWTEKNSHLPKIRTAEEILAQPRPKSDPPQPWPNPSFTDKQTEEWKAKYEKWIKENDHMPRLIPAESIIARMKQGPPSAPGGQAPSAPLEVRVASIETMLTKLMNHLGVK